jgi:hypothetical protein
VNGWLSLPPVTGGPFALKMVSEAVMLAPATSVPRQRPATRKPPPLLPPHRTL